VRKRKQEQGGVGCKKSGDKDEWKPPWTALPLNHERGDALGMANPECSMNAEPWRGQVPTWPRCHCEAIAEETRDEKIS